MMSTSRMRKLNEHLKNREAMLRQEESFVRQLDADNEKLRTFKRLYRRPRTRRMNIVNEE